MGQAKDMVASTEWFFHKVLKWPLQDKDCLPQEEEPINQLLDMTSQIVDGNTILWTKEQ